MHRVKASNILLTLVCLGLMVPGLICAFPFLVGADYSFVVASRSMSPIQVGDIVLVKGVAPSEIRVGDIISYRFRDMIVTHRVIDMKEGLFQLRGDSNPEPDPYWVEPSKILGRVYRTIPLSFIGSPYVYGPLVSVPSIVLLIRAGYKAHHKREIWDTTSSLLLAIVTLTVLNAVALLKLPEFV